MSKVKLLLIALAVIVGGFAANIAYLTYQDTQKCEEWKAKVKPAYDYIVTYVPGFNTPGLTTADFARTEVEDLYGEEWQPRDSSGFPAGPAREIPHPPFTSCEEEFFEAQR